MAANEVTFYTNYVEAWTVAINNNQHQGLHDLIEEGVNFSLHHGLTHSVNYEMMYTVEGNSEPCMYEGTLFTEFNIAAGNNQ